MATFDSAWCLSSFNKKAFRPVADTITDAAKYQRLTDAQNRVVALMTTVAPSSLYPHVGYGSLPTLTSTDGQVFTFGSDANGYAKFPMGKGGIYASLNDIPSRPWVEGRDYMNEGTQIRIPNNGSYGGTLYWYGIAQPADIDGTNQPAISPEPARELIVLEAVRQFAQEGMRNIALADEMQNEFDKAWPVWCTVWKTQYRGGGALAVMTGRDLASVGTFTSAI